MAMRLLCVRCLDRHLADPESGKQCEIENYSDYDLMNYQGSCAHARSLFATWSSTRLRPAGSSNASYRRSSVAIQMVPVVSTMLKTILSRATVGEMATGSPIPRDCRAWWKW